MRRREFAAAAAAVLVAAGAAQAQGVSGLGAHLRDLAATRTTLARLSTAATAIGPATPAPQRGGLVAEIETVAVALETFQADRTAFLARLESLLRIEEAKAVAPGASTALTAAGQALRTDLSQRITALGRANGELRAALARSPQLGRLSAGAPGGLVAQGTLREDMREALDSNVGIRGQVGGRIATADLSATQITELRQLAAAYRGLDGDFLAALSALYAARARLLAAS